MIARCSTARSGARDGRFPRSATACGAWRGGGGRGEGGGWRGGAAGGARGPRDGGGGLGCSSSDPGGAKGEGGSEQLRGGLRKRRGENPLCAPTKTPRKNRRWPARDAYALDD